MGKGHYGILDSFKMGHLHPNTQQIKILQRQRSTVNSQITFQSDHSYLYLFNNT